MTDKEISHISNLIKEIRTELGYTQIELAEILNCSQVLISHFEKGTREIPDDMLIKLSTLNKTDLLDYTINRKKFKNLAHYQHFHNIISVMQYSEDMQKLQFELDKDITKELDYGEPLLLKTYCCGLIQLYLKHDYEKAIDVCLEGLGCTIDDLLNTSPSILKSPYYYACFLVIISAQGELADIDVAIELTKLMLSHLDYVYSHDYFKHIRQNQFMSNCYVLLLGTYSDFMFRKNNYNEALESCNLMLKKSKELHSTSGISYVLVIKAASLYKLGDIEGAKTVFYQIKAVCELYNLDKFFEITKKDFEEKYPAIFN